MSLFLIRIVDYHYSLFKLLDIWIKFYNPWSIAQSKEDPQTQTEDLTPWMTDIYLSWIWNSVWQIYICLNEFASHYYSIHQRHDLPSMTCGERSALLCQSLSSKTKLATFSTRSRFLADVRIAFILDLEYTNPIPSSFKDRGKMKPQNNKRF